MKQVNHWVSRFVATLLALSIPMQAFANCDFKTGIEKMQDGRYAYTLDCHKAVGKLVADSKDKDDQIAALSKTIDLKDLGLKTQEQRAQLWMDTSLKLEDRVNQMEAMRSTNNFLYFGLGIVVTGAAVWGASQLRR